FTDPLRVNERKTEVWEARKQQLRQPPDQRRQGTAESGSKGGGGAAGDSGGGQTKDSSSHLPYWKRFPVSWTKAYHNEYIAGCKHHTSKKGGGDVHSGGTTGACGKDGGTDTLGGQGAGNPRKPHMQRLNEFLRTQSLVPVDGCWSQEENMKGPRGWLGRSCFFLYLFLRRFQIYSVEAYNRDFELLVLAYDKKKEVAPMETGKTDMYRKTLSRNPSLTFRCTMDRWRVVSSPQMKALVHFFVDYNLG
ncbi:hypothetical protein Agub_g4752, partial [Astrephomene gubernaculifera]